MWKFIIEMLLSGGGVGAYLKAAAGKSVKSAGKKALRSALMDDPKKKKKPPGKKGKPAKKPFFHWG